MHKRNTSYEKRRKEKEQENIMIKTMEEGGGKKGEISRSVMMVEEG